MTTERELTARKLWDKTRLVVVDVETTGTNRTSRVVAVAMFCVENGVTVQSWSTLVSPGAGAIGAESVHRLNASKLTGSPSFAQVADKIRALMTSPAKTVYLVAQNATFDAGRLGYEYARLNEELEPVLLLDTKRLCPAAGLGSYSNNLAQLADLFGLKNPAAHEANADALIAREVALRAIDKLIDMGHSDLSQFARPHSSSNTDEDDPELALPPEHLAVHSQPMTNRALREASLTQCLDWQCPMLNRRIEDGLTSPASARLLFSWVLSTIGAPGLSRYQVGLLADGASRALAGWRDQLKGPNPGLMLVKSLELLDSYRPWKRCTRRDLCDQCQAGRPERCRFVRVPTSLVWTILFNSEELVPESVARKFLYGTGARPCGPTSWYAQFRSRRPEQALRGAVVAGRSLRSVREGDVARVAMNALWGRGLRTPGLTEICAALAEDDLGARVRLLAWKDAVAICEEGIRAGGGGPAWERVAAKRLRLSRRIAAREKPPAKDRYNKRPAHTARFIKP